MLTFVAIMAMSAASSIGDTSACDDKVQVRLTGVVRGPDGEPVAGATVWLPGYYGNCRPESGDTDRGFAVTDAAGRYKTMIESKREHLGAVLDRGVSVEARGFVRAENCRLGPVQETTTTLELDIKLARGDVIAGVIDVPLRLADRLKGVRSEGRRFMIRVKSPSFSQVHYTTDVFELWVPPKGVYDLELAYDGQGANPDNPSGWLKGVASGTRGLRLAKHALPVDKETLAQAFDALWEDMFWYYSYFELKGIDWPALGKKYRPRAVAAGTLPAFLDVLGELLGELNDDHVSFLDPPGAAIASRPWERPVDQNDGATEATIDDAKGVGNGFARVGMTRKDGFGVVRIMRMSRSDDAAVGEVVEFIRAHHEAPGFVVDLRGADGGAEGVGRRIASEFCARNTVYARSKYRGGPGPGDFGPTYERELDASARPYTKPVVCVLGPGCVSSGEAFAKMMKCLPNIITVGRPTRGSSGNPRPCTLPGVPVTVLYSRWVDMLPDGTPVEGRGVPPAVRVDSARGRVRAGGSDLGEGPRGAPCESEGGPAWRVRSTRQTNPVRNEWRTN